MNRLIFDSNLTKIIKILDIFHLFTRLPDNSSCVVKCSTSMQHMQHFMMFLHTDRKRETVDEQPIDGGEEDAK